jgi:C4-type Zn-finger protein
MRASVQCQQEFAALQKTRIVKGTHLCCDIVKHCGYGSNRSDAEEVTMPAIAEIPSTGLPRSAPRGSDFPTCPVCADSMIAAEASAFLSESVISYLWSCDTCGYGFVTKHAVRQMACN